MTDHTQPQRRGRGRTKGSRLGTTYTPRLFRPPVVRPDGTIEIQLTKGYVAIIDAEDAHLAQHNWAARVDPTNGKVYAGRTPRPTTGAKKIWLHREVLQTDAPMVDHRDGDTLNCRRANLREADAVINGRNITLPKTNTSGHLGVFKVKNRWRASIGRTFLGSFVTIEEAVAARLAAERELWGVQPRRAEAHAAE